MLGYIGKDVRVISSHNTPIIPVKRLMNPTFALSASARVSLRKYTVVHAHNLPSALPMRMARGRRVLTLHGTYSEQVSLLHGSLLGRLSGWFEKRALGWADAVTAVSREAAQKYRGLGFEVTHVPNAVDLEQMPAEGYRLAENQVIYVGRLSKEKGVDVLLEASKGMQKANIFIIGSGPDESNLRSKAKQLPNITFLGARPRSEALRYIRGSDVLVLPSLLEGLSTVMLEAMALKTPVVATKVGGNTEVMSHMETGLLVERGQPQALADAVNMLLQRRRLAGTLAENAYRLVAREYSWPVVLEKYLAVYGLADLNNHPSPADRHRV